MMNDTEQLGSRTAPDVSKTSRFATAVGLILLAYVLADGQLGREASSSLVGFIVFKRPWVILLFLVAVSAYASSRYWYYGIMVPMTRTKIREFLKTDKSVLVFKRTAEKYKELIQSSGAAIFKEHLSLEQRCPPGLTPFEFIVFTDAHEAPAEGYMRLLVANRVNRYFPSIVGDEIELVDHGTHAWATVSKLKGGTRWRATLEDIDLYAPVLINGAAIVLFIVFIILPRVWSILQRTF